MHVFLSSPYGGQGKHQDVNCLLLNSCWDGYVQSKGHYHSWTPKPIVNDAKKGNKENVLSSFFKKRQTNVSM